jgi:hypothetical protein
VADLVDRRSDVSRPMRPSRPRSLLSDPWSMDDSSLRATVDETRPGHVCRHNDRPNDVSTADSVGPPAARWHVRSKV